MPDLIGIAELATVLGVTKATATRRVSADGFPSPVAQLIQGPLWSGYAVVNWYAETAPFRHHSRLSPYGPIPSEWARSIVAIRIEAEAINGVRLPHHLVKSCVGREGSASLLGLDLLECFDLLKDPQWKIPESSPGNDPLAQFPKTAMAKWRRTSELSIGVGTAPGCPTRRLVAQFGTDSDWSEDMWGQATMQAHSLLDQAVARSPRQVERFYPGSLSVAAVRDVHDNVELLVDGVGRPFERRMPTEEETLLFVWGRHESTALV